MPAMTEDEVKEIWDISEIASYDDRWRLHNYWLEKYRKIMEEDLLSACESYEKATRKLQEINNQSYIEVLQNSRIVGLTTTGAAKYHHLIQNIKPQIVVIEEAAEVLEAHVITTLTSSTQHVILIGDHQQLRPKSTDFTLQHKYHLDISLFERLVKRGLECHTLSTQRRMRPEISRLLAPIYPNLQDHPIGMHDQIGL